MEIRQSSGSEQRRRGRQQRQRKQHRPGWGAFRAPGAGAPTRPRGLEPASPRQGQEAASGGLAAQGRDRGGEPRLRAAQGKGGEAGLKAAAPLERWRQREIPAGGKAVSGTDTEQSRRCAHLQLPCESQRQPREAAPASAASRERGPGHHTGPALCRRVAAWPRARRARPRAEERGCRLARPAGTLGPGAGWLCCPPSPPMPSARGCVYLDGPPEPAGCQVSSQRLLGRLPTGLRIPQLRPLGRLLATGRRNRMKRNKRKEKRKKNGGEKGRGGGKGRGEEWQKESRK